MLNDQANTQSSRPPRAKKLSPELSEFLHMLNALEVQMGSQEVAAAQTR